MGCINLADEYINTYEKHGHWKDASVMIEGKAAWSFTLMFLEMWELCTGIDEDYALYYPWKTAPCEVESDGFVQPYADSPMDKENVGEHVYLQIINNAKRYVYINTLPDHRRQYGIRALPCRQERRGCAHRYTAQVGQVGGTHDHTILLSGVDQRRREDL